MRGRERDAKPPGGIVPLRKILRKVLRGTGTCVRCIRSKACASVRREKGKPLVRQGRKA